MSNKPTYPFVKSKWIEIKTYLDGHSIYTSNVIIQKSKFLSIRHTLDSVCGEYYLSNTILVNISFDTFEKAEKALNEAIDCHFEYHRKTTLVSSVKKYL